MKKIGILAVGVLVLHSIGVNNKYNKIHSKLDIVIEQTNNTIVDSLKLEVMDYGYKLDSMRLQYDYAWAFTN